MAQNAKAKTGYGFGAFKGVFTPSVLTILGVVMYLRFGWVLGNVGLFQTLLIVTLASSITFLTGLALSSLATNMHVGGGGAYYIISRSLGIEVGAAVGIPLFFAQALGISFYTAGFSESVVAIWPSLSPVLVGVVTLFTLAVIAYFSANLALKTQYVVMAVIAASLVSFFLGASPDTGSAVNETAPVARESFWIVFAVFFPAVTGIEAGIALSGDLEDPAKSLPRGTLGAVLVGYAVYLAIPIFLYYTVKDTNLLLTNSLVMSDVARWGHLVIAGLWGACLSSAMGAMLGAPRTLQALALDGIAPRFLGRAFGKRRDPRIATVAAFLIALTGVLLGDLNAIAPVLSMFFLVSYGLLNLTAGFEELISSPSWRPKFRTSWKLNFVAAFGCLAVMLMINPGATFIAAAVAVGLYYLMQRRGLVTRWADVRSGVLMLFVRYAIEHLAKRDPDEKNWKPNLLVLTGSPTLRWYLVEFASAICRQSSFMTVATVLTGEHVPYDRVEQARKTIRDFIAKHDIESLVKVVRAPEAFRGLRGLIRAYGFGPIAPNTVLMGQSESAEHFSDYLRLIRVVFENRKNLVIMRGGEERPDMGETPRVDIWWRRESPNAGLMLALAGQIKRGKGWEKASLSIKTIVDDDPSTVENETAEAEKHLREFVERERIDAEVEVLTTSGGSAFQTIGEASKGANLVFLGMRAPEDGESDESYGEHYRQLLDCTTGLPPTAFVFAAEKLNFGAIFRSN